MGLIIEKYETKYDAGDVVIFNNNDNGKNHRLFIGIIVGFYIDHNADDSIWYNIKVNKDLVYCYGCMGDVAEWDIVDKITDQEIIDKCNKIIGVDENEKFKDN